MAKALIIAEKPSVAGDIARALGGFKKYDAYYESDQYVLSSAIGHLLELAVPEEFEVKRGKWTFAHLPVIPPHFELAPIERAESRLKLLVKLIKRKDVTALINACDAGREGELIFRYIVQHTKIGKPIQRLWLQSMTPQAIKDGFAGLRSDADMRPLADAAVCRSESDWLIGINGTRAMTAFNSKTGGFHKTTVGRVQTPTLAIVVEREERIRRFEPRTYWEIEATFGVAAGEYSGRWFDEGFDKSRASEHERAERLWDKAKAESIRAKCLGKPGVVTEESKPATQLSPPLFDLTSLQREANSRFGFSAKMTLGLAQALYEKHKVLTYPRTDARALPEDYLATVKATLKALSGSRYAPFAGQILKGGWARPNKRIFNNAKISDHFAIIPTLLAPKHLSEPEQKLYDMVVKRFLAVFFPPAEHLVTTRITRVEGEPFKTEGRILVNAGWTAIYGKEAEEADAAPQLAPVGAKEKATASQVTVQENQTKPPARYTEATLLSAMEGAGKLVEDEELREAMREKGLGTPATRAQIIENLLQEDYLHRAGRELQPTAKAFQLITALRGLKIDELASPELTGDWEYKLAQMEHGKLKRTAFMEEIAGHARRMVQQIKEHQDDTILGDFATLSAPCPRCGGVVKESYKKFQCEKCDYSLWKVVSARQFEPREIDELLTKRVVGPLTGFRSKLGRPFAALVRLNDNHEPEFDFGDGGRGEDGAAEAVDFSGHTPLGICPKCGAGVFEHGMAYICEKAVGKDKNCDFRTGKVILQLTIEPEQVKKLLATGKTDLLQNFVSKRNGRRFAAHLVVKDGKVGFEFAARGERKTKAGAAKPAVKAPPKRRTAAG